MCRSMRVMQGHNIFISKHRFVSFSRWSEPAGSFLLWPCAWVDWATEPSLGVRITRWNVGIGYARFRMNWGWNSRPDPLGKIDWESSGLAGFLEWSQRVFGKSWRRTDLDALFRQRPEWHRLVSLGGADAHYVRLLLARELFEAPRTSTQTLRTDMTGLSALEAALEMDEAAATALTGLSDDRGTTRPPPAKPAIAPRTLRDA